MGYHAKLSPSSAHRWTECTASINAQAGLPNENSEASMMGTVCHQLCAEVLQTWLDLGKPVDYDLEADDYLGRVMLFWESKDRTSNGEDWREAFSTPLDPQRTWTAQVPVTTEMVDACNIGLDYVRTRVLTTGAHVEVEQRVPIGHFTGEPGATGTSDVVIIYDDVIESLDFKFGRHKVDAYDVLVPARGDQPPVLRMNLQLACYVLGAYHKFGLIYDIQVCRAVIIQPFLNHVSEFTCSLTELLDVQEDFLRPKAEETRTNLVFAPSKDNCHYCKARMTCEAREQMAVELCLDGFTDAGEPIPKGEPPTRSLGALYASLDFIREWCDDVAKRVFNEIKAGREILRPDGLRYVLKTGRKGDRQWADPEQAEHILRSMNLKRDEMYVSKLVGPATIEKLAKVPKRKKPDTPAARLGAEQWELLQTLITQKDGQPSVALETDTRPTLPSSAEGFVDVADDVSDLMN